MPRAFPVPIYATTAVFAGLNRTLTTTSPGSTDSTATTTGYALAARQTYLSPEAANNSTSDIFPKTTAGGISGHGGWVLNPVGPIVPDANTPWSVEAGTWSIQFHVSRDNPLLSSDVTGVTLRAQLVRMPNDTVNGLVLQSIGTASKTGVTITTTETAHQLDISGVAATFAAGERLALVLFWEWALQVSVSGSARAHTNSTTGIRITAAPQFTRQYANSLADSAVVSDAVARQVAYARNLGDGAPLADAITRAVTMPRALVDSAPASDALTRQSIYARALADSAPASDTIIRQAAYLRSLQDSGVVSESLARLASYKRALADNAPAADGLTRIVFANRSLADSAPASDVLTRQASYRRSLADDAPASDVLARRMIYARALQDVLSEGGGGTTIYRRFTPVFDD